LTGVPDRVTLGSDETAVQRLRRRPEPVPVYRPASARRHAPDAAAFLRVHRLGEEAARVAATLDLPMTLTMRGCVVYGTKAGTTPRSA